jgi:hypothetical protein
VTQGYVSRKPGLKEARFRNNGDRWIREAELANMLGIDSPRVFRRRIERYRSYLERFGRLRMRDTVVTTKGSPRGLEIRTVSEYVLNERQALFMIVKSDTKLAAEVLMRLLGASRELRGMAAVMDRKLARIGDEAWGSRKSSLPFVADALEDRWARPHRFNWPECAYCASAIEAGSEFCSNCGMPIPKK